MKTNRIIFALILTAVLIFSVSLAAAETRITVTGTGETKVSADTAVISLGVSARDQDVLQAQQKVNAAIADIRAALIEKGVKEENINTDYMNIYAIYSYEDDLETVLAYNASCTLAIRVEDMETTGEVIDTAFAAGANTLNGISFSAKDTEEAEAESLKQAVADAKRKAEIIAEASGMQITGIEIITEGGTYSYSNSVSNFSARGTAKEEARDAGAGTVVQAAKLIVNATVSITFTAE